MTYVLMEEQVAGRLVPRGFCPRRCVSERVGEGCVFLLLLSERRREKKRQY